MIQDQVRIEIFMIISVVEPVTRYLIDNSTPLARVARASAVLLLKKHERLGFIFLPIPETISPLQESQK